MEQLFVKLGRKAGKTWIKGRWAFQSIFGTEEEGIDAEQRLGAELNAEMRQEVSLISDTSLQSDITSIGAQLTARLTKSQREYHFYGIQSSDINAFALPGGFIYIAAGLLNLPNLLTHELAFILGHEIGHVHNGHPFDRLLAQTSLNLFSRIKSAGSILGNAAKTLSMNLIRSNYSQEQELEADWFGVRMLHSAGYDVNAAVNALQMLHESKGKETVDFHYFSTHPSIEKRISEIRRRLNG